MSFLSNGVSQSISQVEDVFNSGSFEILYAEDEIVVFQRKLDTRVALVVVNTGSHEKTVPISLEPGEIFTSSFGLEPLVVGKSGNIELNIEACSVDVFHNQLYNVC